MHRLLRALALLALLVTAPLVRAAETPAAPGVRYELIARWEVAKLNKILTTDTPNFFGTSVTYTPATNAVRLYRVTYPSFIPEQGNRPTVATGLLAVPEVAAARMPLVSYQHGRVHGKQQVPSYPDQSPETQLMIAQFAGQGYLLIGADCCGMGGSAEPEGYMVKASHQQATHDMLLAARAVLAQMKLTPTRLDIAG